MFGATAVFGVVCFLFTLTSPPSSSSLPFVLVDNWVPGGNVENVNRSIPDVATLAGSVSRGP